MLRICFLYSTSGLRSYFIWHIQIPHHPKSHFTLFRRVYTVIKICSHPISCQPPMYFICSSSSTFRLRTWFLAYLSCLFFYNVSYFGRVRWKDATEGVHKDFLRSKLLVSPYLVQNTAFENFESSPGLLTQNARYISRINLQKEML